MTFSIVAYDPDTGEIGVAVQSKAFSVGNLVGWAKAGVGAVATQSMVNITLGPIGLDLMESGRTPEQVMEYFREIDGGIEKRQLGIVSVKHGSYTFTGNENIAWAGGYKGKNFVCQGNILTGKEVVDEFAKVFENSYGSLAERMLEGLTAAQKAGGDSRGKQSAAIIIEQEGRGRAGYGSRKIDLRVDDHEDPIPELVRLYSIAKMNETIYSAYALFTDDPKRGIKLLEEAIDDRRDRYWDEAWMALSSLYFQVEDLANSRKMLDICFGINSGMINIFKYYPDLGLGFSADFVKEVLETRK